MKHSTKLSAQLLAQHLQSVDISHVIISPGSRNAPLIIELTNNSFFNNYSVVDERSAGFFALGMAQQLQKPVALVCSSGTALLNYAPAVAEAFYSKIPLVVISADRPQKWIDHGEGQTIRQDKALANHTYFDTTLLEDHQKNALGHNNCQIVQALKSAFEKQGPVHINVPFDEPLYETVNDKINIETSIDINIIDKIYPETFIEKFAQKWLVSDKKMVLVGQHPLSDSLQSQLEKLSQDPSVIVLNENISNIQHLKFINNIDQAIFPLSDDELESLKPDILLTIGRNIISKKVKHFLRKHPPKAHWHIEKTVIPPNTFEVLSQHFNTSSEMFLSQFLFLIYDKLDKNNSTYQQRWLNIKAQRKKVHHNYLKETTFSDLKVFDLLSQYVPKNYMIQWGNSSTIRYAQLFDFHPEIQHFSNRGASGIDGSSSTAVGAGHISDRKTLLVTGDISFLYDSNALWNKYIPHDFKIIVINNGGGDIFNFIPGPSNTNTLDEFFVTKHKLKAKHLAEMFDFKYNLIDNLQDLERTLPSFFDDDKRPQLLEIDTARAKNHQILKNYFGKL